MKIELTRKEINCLLDWYDYKDIETEPSKKDKHLVLRLDKMIMSFKNNEIHKNG